jgi:hypothetical protein
MQMDIVSKLVELLPNPERPIPILKSIAKKYIGHGCPQYRVTCNLGPLATSPPKDYLDRVIARNGTLS